MSSLDLSNPNTRSPRIRASFLRFDKIGSLFILLGVLAFIPSCFWKSPEYTDRVVVKVNDEVLLAKDFALLLAERLRVYDALTVKDPKVISKVKASVVNDFIITKITEDFAKRNGILVKKEDLEAEVNTIRSYYPDDIAFRNVLSDQNLSFEDWTSKLRQSLLQKAVMRKLKENIEEPSEEELKTFYDSNTDLFKEPEAVRLTQIVLKTENDAKQVMEALKSGKKMEEMAKEFSVAPEGMTEGDLGWIEKGVLDIFDHAFDMRKGQRSAILKSPYGYHIYEVRDKRSSSSRGFKVVRSLIFDKIMEKKEQAAYSQWLEFELKTAKVYKDEPLIDSIQVETVN